MWTRGSSSWFIVENGTRCAGIQSSSTYHLLSLPTPSHPASPPPRSDPAHLPKSITAVAFWKEKGEKYKKTSSGRRRRRRRRRRGRKRRRGKRRKRKKIRRRRGQSVPFCGGCHPPVDWVDNVIFTSQNSDCETHWSPNLRPSSSFNFWKH